MTLSIRSRAPSASSPRIRQRMQGVPRRDTAAEILLRKCLFRLGLRYRLQSRPVADVPCTADIVLRSVRICVFIDGCFWHGCPRHFRAPSSNKSWWKEKIADNRMRDRRQSRRLRRSGWTVIRFWEHQIMNNAEACANRVFSAVRQRIGDGSR
jgi:DNA mismatch endonuclease (patch repair protein)